jgi:hypothetical protein
MFHPNWDGALEDAEEEEEEDEEDDEDDDDVIGVVNSFF